MSLGRAPMPPRNKPMPRGSLRRTGFDARPPEIKRTGRLRHRSAKTAKVYREQRIPLTERKLADNPWCGIQWDENCTRYADALHELLPRGRGGSITEDANTIGACNYCNGAVSSHPAEAEKRGFLKKSGRPSKAVPR